MAQSRVSVESRARWAFLGIVLLLTLAGLGWYGAQSARSVTYEIRTHDNATGLMVDSPVEFHGVEVGKVVAVDLTGPASVRLLLRVRKEAPVSAATVATITSRGLASRGFTGYVYVALEDDGQGVGPLPVAAGRVYPQIRVGAARSMNLDIAMTQVNANVQAMSRLLQATLDDGTVASLKQSLASLQQVTRVLAENSGRMKSVAVNLERASRRLEPLLRTGNEAAAALQTQVLPQASQAFIAVDGASSTWRATAERAGRGLDPLLASGNDTAAALQTQLLPQAYDAVANLQRLTLTLDALAQRLQRDPSLLLRATAQRPLGPGEQP
jgi:phospholipid/cholesterol/gamma-HCH transport system substrate-binding protein